MEKPEIRYVDDTKPDLEGPHGKAWKQNVAEAYQRIEDASPPDASVAGWIVEAKWAHPAWHSYAIICVSLRDMDGFPPAHIHRPGATHEIAVFALDPKEKRALNDHLHLLHPANFLGQWVSESDEAAATLIEGIVKNIVEGLLSPDTDYRQRWIEMFGDYCFEEEFRGRRPEH